MQVVIQSARPRRSRLAGTFSRHLRQMVSRSRGSFGCKRDGGSGSLSMTWRIVSSGESARKGGRPESRLVQEGPQP